jgi:hypothetical protein
MAWVIENQQWYVSLPDPESAVADVMIDYTLRDGTSQMVVRKLQSAVALADLDPSGGDVAAWHTDMLTEANS